MPNTNINKVIQPTNTKVFGGFVPVYCRILFEEGRLSITGVEGPKRNGDCHGGCGQIDLTEGTPVEGWTAEQVARLAQVWKDYHLNDMRAGCPHQRKTWDLEEKVEVVTYVLTSKTLTAQRHTTRAQEKRLLAGETVTATAEEIALLSLPYERKSAPDADGPGSGRYEVKKRETKPVSHTYPSEHPRGLLMKPCDVCGYKYGSAWLPEEVPADVIEFLQSLPDSPTTPAWV